VRKELERIGEEAVVAESDVLRWYLSGGTGEKPRTSSVRIVVTQADIGVGTATGSLL
jgi:hypothetical protein